MGKQAKNIDSFDDEFAEEEPLPLDRLTQDPDAPQRKGKRKRSDNSPSRKVDPKRIMKNSSKKERRKWD
ncbi:MAG: hypothetical protein ACW99A_05290 [Candidatus Kariarchaeaceae archaeon]|jgi:hypothetical protein